MATIKNTKDAALMTAYAAGLGRRVLITSVSLTTTSNTFTKPATGAIAPASIGVTATPTNFSAPTITWHYALSTSPSTWTSLAGSTNTQSISSATYTGWIGSTGASIVYIRVTYTESGRDTAQYISPITYVQDGSNGEYRAVLELYQKVGSAPTQPTSVQYTFTGNVYGTVTGGTGTWSSTQPASDATPTYVTRATASTTTPGSAVSVTGWSAPIIVAQSGSAGSTGTRGPVVTKILTTYTTASQAYDAIYAITSVTGASPTNPIKGDIVYHPTGAVECTAAGNPGTWSGILAYISGSMVVDGTLSANALAAGTISASISISSGGYIKATSENATTLATPFTNAKTTGYFSNPTASNSTYTSIGVYGKAISDTSPNLNMGIGVMGYASGDYGVGVYARGTFRSITAVGTAKFDNDIIVDGAITGGSTITAIGNITAYYSDDNLKTRIGPIESAIDKLKTLDTFYYRPNQIAQDLGYKDELEVGVSAQQVQKIMPMIVPPAPINNKYLTVRYERLAPLIIAGINELASRVEALENDNS